MKTTCVECGEQFSYDQEENWTYYKESEQVGANEAGEDYCEPCQAKIEQEYMDD